MSPAARALGVAIAGLCAFTLEASPPATPEVPVTVSLSESVIAITPRYHGELVKVRGTAPADCGVVLKLTSERDVVMCSRKGKVGSFWFAVGRVRFDHVPQMFKIKSNQPLDDLVRPSEQVKYVLGRRGLKASIGVQSGVDRDLYVDELLLIRERERLFGFSSGDVERRDDTFASSFFWPADGPPGRYRIEAYAVREGSVVGSAAASTEVRAVGMEAWVRNLARNHGILYGLFAVGLAVVTGLGASLAFRPRTRRGSGTGAAA